MAAIADEVIRAVGEGGLVVEILADVEAKGLRARLEDEYSPGRRRWPLWEEVGFPAAVQDDKAWSWIGTFIGSQPCLLLFNPRDESTMFRFRSGADLDALLAETYGFEFYVTDQDASYLLCFNHHGILLGAGGASAWVGSKGDPIAPRSTEEPGAQT